MKNKKKIMSYFEQGLEIISCKKCPLKKKCNRKKLGNCYVNKNETIYVIESCEECNFLMRCPHNFERKDNECGEFNVDYIYMSMRLNNLTKMLYPKTIKQNHEEQ